MSYCSVGLSSAANCRVSDPSEYDTLNYVQQRADEYTAAVLYYMRRRQSSPVWSFYGLHPMADSETVYLIDTSAASFAQSYYMQRRLDGPIWIPVVPACG